MDLVSVKALIKSVVVINNGNAFLWNINRLYREQENRDIPFKEAGFPSIAEFLAAIEGIVIKDGQIIPKKTEKSGHIMELMEKQKPQKKRKPRRQPNFSRFSGFQRSTAPRFTATRFNSARRPNYPVRSTSTAPNYPVRSTSTAPNYPLRSTSTAPNYPLRSTSTVPNSSVRFTSTAPNSSVRSTSTAPQFSKSQPQSGFDVRGFPIVSFKKDDSFTSCSSSSDSAEAEEPEELYSLNNNKIKQPSFMPAKEALLRHDLCSGKVTKQNPFLLTNRFIKAKQPNHDVKVDESNVRSYKATKPTHEDPVFNDNNIPKIDFNSTGSKESKSGPSINIFNNAIYDINASATPKSFSHFSYAKSRLQKKPETVLSTSFSSEEETEIVQSSSQRQFERENVAPRDLIKFTENNVQNQTKPSTALRFSKSSVQSRLGPKLVPTPKRSPTVCSSSEDLLMPTSRIQKRLEKFNFIQDKTLTVTVGKEERHVSWRPVSDNTLAAAFTNLSIDTSNSVELDNISPLTLFTFVGDEYFKGIPSFLYYDFIESDLDWCKKKLTITDLYFEIQHYIRYNVFPKNIILLIGSTDLKQDNDMKTMKSSLDGLLCLLRANDVKTILCTIPPLFNINDVRFGKLINYNQHIETLKDDGLRVIDIYEIFSSRNYVLLRDSYEEVLVHIREAIKELNL